MYHESSESGRRTMERLKRDGDSSRTWSSLQRRVLRSAHGPARLLKIGVTSTLMLATTLVIGAPAAHAAGSLLPSGPKTVDKPTAIPGDSLTYQIPYFCSSTIPGDHCNGMTITDQIPTFTDVFGDVRPLDVVAFTSNSQFTGVQLSAPDRVVWTAINLVAGDSGAVTLVLRVPGGVVPSPGIHIANTATLDSAGVQVVTDPAHTDVTVGPPGVTVTKSNNKSTILLGSDSNYTIKICPIVGAGHFPGGYTISDTIPPGSTIVAPIPDGGIEGPPGVVTWTITDANDPKYDPATGCFSRALKLNFPGGAFSSGDSVTNTATVTPGGGTALAPAPDTDIIRVPEPNIVVAKATDAGVYVKDNDPINFSMYFNNQDPEGGKGETTLQNIVMLDGPLPAGFELSSVKPGQWNGGYAATLEVSSTGAAGPWTSVATANGSAAQDVAATVSDPAMQNAADGANRYVRWVMTGPVATNFAFSVAGYVSGTAQAEPFLPSPGLPQTLTNCQSTSADANVAGTLTPITRGPACAANILESPQPAGWIYKYVDNAIRQPGETGVFTLQTANSGDATGDMVISAADPAIISDCMPPMLVLDSIELNGWTDVSPGSTTCVNGERPFQFMYSGDLTVTPGSYLPAVLMHFHISQLGDPLGAAPASVQTNTAQFTQDTFFHCEFPECKYGAAVTIPVSSTLKSRKQVAGFYDPPLTSPVPYTNTSVDTSADTYPGGPISYRIAVLNNGNADVKNFQIVDILPFVGDTGVKVTLQNRYSQFRPVLTGPIVAPVDWLVEYSTRSNPCRPEVSPIGLATCDPPNWTTTPTSFSSVRSYRLTQVGIGGTFDPLSAAIQRDDDIFERGEEIIAEYPMKAPLKSSTYDTGGHTAFPYENLNPAELVDVDPALQTNCRDENYPGDDPASTLDRCPVARNSFAYAGTAFSPDQLFANVNLGSEPPRVDVTVYGPPGNSIGDYVWYDTNLDGTQTPGELPVEGVTVELYMEDPANPGTYIPAKDADGLLVDPTATDADGNYSFLNLPDGNFKVRFYPPAGYIVTTPNASGDPTGVDEGGATTDGSPNTDNDSDVPVAAVGESWTETAPVHLQKQNGVGEADTTWDMGIFKEEYSLGNLVWIDDGAGTAAGAGYNNGIKDPAESPVAGVTIVLYAADAAGNPTGGPLGTQVTDPLGHYRFDHLDPGSYVTIVAASNFLPGGALYKTFPSTGSTPSIDATDADNLDHGLDVPLAGAIEPGGIVSEPVTLGRGLEPLTDNDPTTNPENGEASNAFSNRTVDFGFYRKVRIGNLVWLDEGSGTIANDNNGVVDPGEVGIGGLTVELWEDTDNSGTFDPAFDTQVQTTVTNTEGNYWIEGVEPGGTYFVALPSAPGQSTALGTAPGDPLAADNTDDGEPQGTYPSVTQLITAPFPGSAPTGEIDAIPASDGNADAEANAALGRAFPDENSDLRIDLGFIHVPVYRIGNLVWADPDKNGRVDPGEAPIPGVRVELFDSTGSFVTFTTTGPDGKYLFENLSVGDYEVRIPTGQAALNGYKTSPDIAGVTETNANTDVDNDDNGTLDSVNGYFTSGPVTVGEDNAVGPNGVFNDEPTNEIDILDGNADDDAGSATSADNRSNLTIDFGFYRPAFAIGNEVWLDLDDSGKLDNSEPYAPDGVVVNLLDADGTPVLDSLGNPITTTTVGGKYLFDDLIEGTYIVEIDAANFAGGGLLEGWRSSTFDGVEDAADQDDNGITQAGGAIWSAPFTLTEDGEPTGEIPQTATIALDINANMTVDFGIVVVLSLGNEVWFDLDDDGLLNNGEGYVPDGITVNLLHADATPVLDGSGNPVTTTISAGKYLFTGLLAGDYRVEIPASEFAPTGALFGSRSSTPTAGDTNVDQDDNGDAYNGAIRSGIVNLFPLAEPQAENPDNDPVTADKNENLTWDIGVVPLFSLGNEVWFDMNDNGTLDDGESYVPDGVIVNLLHADGTPVLDASGNPRTTTTVGGKYLFDNLLAGDYVVELDHANFVNSGILGASRSSSTTAGDNNIDQDDNGADAANTTGDFVVRTGVINLSWHAEPTSEDPDNDPVTADPNENLTWDIGIVPLYSIGNEVWIDPDDNGLWNAGDSYVPDGVKVNLLHADGSPVTNSFGVALTTTTIGGLYLFDRLEAGDYQVEIDPSNFAPGGQLYGYRSSTPTSPEDAVDQDDNGAPIDPAQPYSSGIRSTTFTLGFEQEPLNEDPDNDPNTHNGNENLTVDFGVYQAIMALGDIVWYDLNRNGVQDAGEKPVVGATAHLLMEDPANPGTFIDALDVDGNPVADDATDPNGYYLFDNLFPGNYKVVFTHNQLGYRWTVADSADPSATDANDSDATHVADSDATATTGIITLDPTQANVRPTTAADNTTYGMTLKASFVDPTNDAGIWMPVAMGDYVWYDLDHDGAQFGPGEIGVQGVTAELLMQDPANPGTYIPVTVDATGNPVTTTMTDASGWYGFGNLVPGNYKIQFSTLPLGWSPTTPNGVSDTADSDADPGTLLTDVFTLSVDATVGNMAPNDASLVPGYLIDPTIDMGIFQSVTLGDLVWYDVDRDGIYDPATETGVSGVNAHLLMENPANPGSFIDATDADGAAVADVPTGTDGRYSFSNLRSGTYKVVFTLPNGYEWTKTDQGSDDSLDSDAVYTSTTDSSATTGARLVSALSPPADNDAGGLDLTDPTFDAGIWFPFALGDVVWYDLNRNGVQDATENTVVGATAHLLMEDPANPGAFIDAIDADDNPVTDQTTDANGRYLFDYLLPGIYTVVFTHNQTGYLWTNPDATGDATDSDAGFTGTNADATASTGPITIATGQPNVRPTTPTDDTTYATTVRATFIDPTNDAGIWTPLAVGDYVWYDLNYNGIQDGTEKPVGGVKVMLLMEDPATPGTFIAATDADGNPVAVATTDPVTGEYVFDNLVAGSYQIQFDLTSLPAGYAPTKQTQGTDVAKDSNPAATGLSAPFTLAPTGDDMVPNTDLLVNAIAINPTIDLGIFTAVSLGDLVWYDANRDGIYDPATEQGVGAVKTELLMEDPANPGSYIPALDATGVAVPPSFTDDTGRYSFVNLISGNFKVVFTLPAGFEWTKSGTPGDDTLDSDALFLTGTDATSTTGVIFVSADAAVTDTDPNGLDLTDPSIDAGIWLPFAIGDKVWFDLDHNGVQGAADAPVVGATATLLIEDPAAPGSFIPALDADGAAVAADTTDANGYYVFDNLLPGTYIVEFTHNQVGFQWSLTNAGVDDTVDSDAAFLAETDAKSATGPIVIAYSEANVRGTTPSDDTTYGTALRASYIDPTNDAGIWMPLAVGDYVWYDLNHNGIQEAGDTPVGGVGVSLLMEDPANAGTFIPARDADGALVDLDDHRSGDRVVRVRQPDRRYLQGAVRSRHVAGRVRPDAPDAGGRPDGRLELRCHGPDGGIHDRPKRREHGG